MPQSEARAWWADVQDVRETIERRRAAEQAEASPHRPHTTRSHRPEAASPRRSAGARGPGRARRRPDGARRPLHLAAQPPAATDRRTVEITGRPAPPPRGPVAAVHGSAPVARTGRRRPSPSPAERLAHRPDRIAAWAAVMGFAMMVIAAL
jgi:hypothetical protein